MSDYGVISTTPAPVIGPLQVKVGGYHKAVVRQNMQQAQWLQKRKQENAARRAAGVAGCDVLTRPWFITVGCSASAGFVRFLHARRRCTLSTACCPSCPVYPLQSTSSHSFTC